MNPQNKKTSFAETSWIITAFAVCLFPYFGIFVFLVRALFERKMHISDSDYMLGPALGMILWGSAAIILMSLILEFGTETLLVLSIFLLPVICGVILLKMRKKYRKKDDKLRLCNTIITRGFITDLEKIAECLRISVKDTAALIDQLIEKKRLTGCSLNEERNMLIIHAAWANTRYHCEYCGAEQIIKKGVDLVCKFCGNPIQ